MNPSSLLSALVISTLFLEEIQCHEFVFQVQNAPPEIVPGLYPSHLFSDLTAALSELQPVFLYAPSQVPQSPGPSFPRRPLLDSSRPSLTYGFVPKVDRSRPTSTQKDEDSNRYRSTAPSFHQRNQPPRQVRFKSAEADAIVPAHSLQSTSKVRALSSLGPLRPQHRPVSYERDARGNYVPVNYYDGPASSTNGRLGSPHLGDTNSERSLHNQKTSDRLKNGPFESSIATTNWDQDSVNQNGRKATSHFKNGFSQSNTPAAYSKQNLPYHTERKTSGHLKNGPSESSIATTNWDQDSDSQYGPKASTNFKNGLSLSNTPAAYWEQNLQYHTERKSSSHQKNVPLESHVPSEQHSKQREREKDAVKNVATSGGGSPTVSEPKSTSPAADRNTKRYLLIKAPTLVTTKRPASAPFVASSFRNIPQSAPRPDVGRQSTLSSTANRNIAKEESPYILDVPDSDLYYQVEDDPLSKERRFDASESFRNASGSYLPAQSISSSVSVNVNGDAKKVDKSPLKKSPKKKSKVPKSDESEDVPGVPGSDYPTYDEIPTTQFECKDSIPPGFYADLETGCQVFHNCDTRRQKHSFLCPNGTVFRQELFICDWWYNVRCDTSTEHFPLNDGLFPRH